MRRNALNVTMMSDPLIPFVFFLDLPQKVWLDAPPPNVFLHSGTTFLWAISPVVGIPQVS